jgi:hypothetical protein
MVTLKEALEDFGASGADSFCEGQFYVTKAAICCFIDANGTSQSFLESPSRLQWKPARLDYHPEEDLAWFPAAARETRPGPARITSAQNAAEWLKQQNASPPPPESFKEHYLFLRRPGESQYLYAGPAHLSAYSMSVTAPEATFDLKQRLPRKAWLELGGFDGWLAELDDKPHKLDNKDIHALDSLLESFQSARFSHLKLTRYEEDELTVYRNPRCAFPMYLRRPGDSGLYLKNDVASPDEREHFRCDCGIDLKMQTNLTVEVQNAAQLVRAFFLTGKLPNESAWVEC